MDPEYDVDLRSHPVVFEGIWGRELRELDLEYTAHRI